MSTTNEPEKLPPVPCPLSNNATPLAIGKLRVIFELWVLIKLISYVNKQLDTNTQLFPQCQGEKTLCNYNIGR